MKHFRIVLLADNKLREIAGLQLLKRQLEQNARFPVQVYIVGSIAEVQRVYFLLDEIKPDIVFISQIQEKFCRSIAQYVRKSGGKLFVLPSEVTPARVVQSLVVSSHLTYDHLLDGIFLPGKKMHSFFSATDINKKKLLITGSPKIDAVSLTLPVSRNKFSSEHNLPLNKKNVFIFTSFPLRSDAYYESDECFSENLQLMKNVHTAIKANRNAYIQKLPEICRTLSEFTVVLKPHPLEDSSVYNTIQEPNFRIITQATVQDCIPSIDVCIHWNSTACVECWLHNVTSIQYSPITSANWLLSDFTPGNPVYSDSVKMTKQILEYLKNEKKIPQRFLSFQKRYIEENFFRSDGKAAQRISSHVNSVMKVLSRSPITHTYAKSGRLWAPFHMLEKILGVANSRHLIGILFRSYNWRYAAENYIFESK